MDNKLRISAVLVIAALLTLSGCIEDPEEKAAKEARAANVKALEVLQGGGNAADVRKELEKALLAGKEAPSTKQITLLIGANLSFDEAEQAQMELVEILQNIPALLEKVSKTTAEIRESGLEQNRLRRLLAAGDKQIQQLTDMLEGTDEQEAGLRAKLEDLQRQSDELLNKKELLHRQLNEAQTQAAELQRKADNLLRMAEQQTDQQEKIWLQQRAFELLKGKDETNDQLPLGRTGWLAKAQKALDGINDLESELAFVIPRIDKLTANVATAEKRIEDIEGSANRGQMRTRLRDIQSQNSDQQGQIRKLLEQLSTVESNYGKTVNKVVDLFGKTGNEYDKINSPADKQMVNIARMAAGDCFYKIGRIYVEYMKLQSQLARQLNLLANTAEAEVSRELGNAARKYAGNVDKYGNKAVENYDQAIEVYDKLHRMTGRKKDDFALSAATNYILVLYAKARLAEKSGREDWRSQAVEQAQELGEQTAEYDPDFEQSITGNLLQNLK